jgi:hypothetical protein
VRSDGRQTAVDRLRLPFTPAITATSALNMTRLLIRCFALLSERLFLFASFPLGEIWTIQVPAEAGQEGLNTI